MDLSLDPMTRADLVDATRLGRLTKLVQRSWMHWLLLSLASVFLFFYGLGAADLWRTEGLRAIVAQEMLTSGDWIVPRLYGEPFFTKPPGMYFAIAFCSWPVGHVTDLTARLPSALAAAICVLLFSWHFRRRLGKTAGLVAGLVLPMAPMWIDKATSAEIDMLQTTWVTAAILLFFRAVDSYERNESRSSGWWLAALLCMTGGLLTKWTAPEFFYGTVIPYLWWKGRLRLLWRWPHLLSVAVAGAIVMAWVFGVYLRGEATALFETVIWEGLSRLVPGYNTYRPYPWLESLGHPFRVLLNTLPWSALALLTLRPSFWRSLDKNQQDVLAALHCWVWPQVLFWSLPNEHTPRHSFPLFPGMAGLAVMVWLAWHEGRLPWKMPRVQPTKLLASALALWMAAKAFHVEVVVPQRCHARQPRNKGAVLRALVPEGQTLYVLRLKDEGIMFYYGRSVVRVNSADVLPADGAPVYCLLNQHEWRDWSSSRRAELVQRLDDEQGEAIYLVRVF